MPYLQVNGSNRDGINLFATMIYPNNENKREEYASCRFVEGLINISDAGNNADILRQLEQFQASEVKTRLQHVLHARSYEKVIEDSKVAGWKGILAGMIFLLVYLMDKKGTKEPSIGKAQQTLLKSMKARPEIYNGKSYKESTIECLWKEFRSVAHLWAAGFAFLDVHTHTCAEVSLLQNADKIIAHSEMFRKFGQKFILSRVGNRSLLIPNLTWQPPSSYPIIDVEQNKITMGKDLENLLKSYSTNQLSD